MSDTTRYTKTDIAAALDIPRNTLTLYINNFKEMIPSHQENGHRYPLYDTEAMEMLNDIRELYSNNKKKHEVRHFLTEKYNTVNDSDSAMTAYSRPQKGHSNDSSSDSAMTVVASNVANEAAARILKGLESVRYLNDTLVKTSDQLASDNKKLRFDNETLQQQVKQLTDELEATKNDLLELKRPTVLQQIFGAKKEA